MTDAAKTPVTPVVCLQIAAALTHNFSGLVAVRFFTGFLGSPVLATAGASLQDVYNPMYLPIVFSLWALSAFMGPSLGPLISGFAVSAHDWRWSMWELLWIVGFAEILLLTLMPETSHPTILLRRAKRLRKLTGNNKIRSMGELEQERLKVSEVMLNAFVRPTQVSINPRDNLSKSLHSSPQFRSSGWIRKFYFPTFISHCCTQHTVRGRLTLSGPDAVILKASFLFLLDLFFAAFPAWQARLGWSISIQGVSVSFVGYYTMPCQSDVHLIWQYVSILIGGLIGCVMYIGYQVTYMVHYYKTKGWPEPEQRLEPALLASFLLPIGLFIFGKFRW